MAATTTRAIAMAATTSTSTLIAKNPFFLNHKLFPRNALKLPHSFCSSSKRSYTCKAIYNPEVLVKEEGYPETLDYRVFLVNKSGKKVSPWHDIPLRLGDGVFNCIVEIPKESSAKMEVATDEPYTPIKQDTKKGKLRYYPYNIHWNYGLLPQTWEDPSFSNSEVEGAFGDNDPVDVVEIGERRRKIGEVLRVKPLAALAMIDEGELDWKIVAISLDDPKASLVSEVDDVEKHFPGTLTQIRDWFRDYKIPDGKPANKFGLGNKAANKCSFDSQVSCFADYGAWSLDSSSTITFKNVLLRPMKPTILFLLMLLPCFRSSETNWRLVPWLGIFEIVLLLLFYEN